MCGRYQQLLSPEELEVLYGLHRKAWGRDYKFPNYNVAPRQSVPVVVMEEGQRAGRTMRWGFPPQWVRAKGKDPFNAPPLVNAKAETALSKRTWADALEHRRCLVPTTGFYEWIRQGKKALYPFLIKRWEPEQEGADTLTLAGIWGPFAWGDDPEKQAWPCMAILTASPPEEVSVVHDRCPLALRPADWDRWLDPSTPMDQVTAMLAPVADGELDLVEVSTALNDRRNNGPETMVADWDAGAILG